MCEEIRIFCLLLLAAAPIAKADPDTTALLQQVKQIAAQGQDAQTTAQVNQYVDQNQDAISTILKGYTNYLKQVQVMADDGTAASAATRSATSAAPQSSTTLRISTVQPSGSLKTSHLAGYPALPDADPMSSITQPAADQLAYAAKVQKEVQARKQYLMDHPEGYTY